MGRSIAPVAEAARYCLRGLGLKKWKSHVRSFDLMLMYCVTPPVTPKWEPERWVPGSGFDEPRPKLCIACGRVHITSKDCGRERPEKQFRSAVPRNHDGYTLQRAANMGCFSESDNWE